MTSENLKRLQRAKEFDYITQTAVPVAYEYQIVSADGAAFTLLREAHHTDSDIRKAKSFLYNSDDVVRLNTETLS
jgi:hypothetical protein